MSLGSTKLKDLTIEECQHLAAKVVDELPYSLCLDDEQDRFDLATYMGDILFDVTRGKE